MSEIIIITPTPGLVVTFDDPFDSGCRMVASYVPGSVDDRGELVDLAWVDSYGGYWKFADILASNPRVWAPPTTRNPGSELSGISG
jgi:hypothetical protein